MRKLSRVERVWLARLAKGAHKVQESGADVGLSRLVGRGLARTVRRLGARLAVITGLGITAAGSLR